MDNTPSNSERLRRERDYYINYINIVSYTGKEYSIKNQMIEFTYHENIGNPCAYCSVTLYDVIDFPTLLPMIGEERLKVSFTRQDENAVNSEGGLLPPIVIDMPIYKISNRSPENSNRKGQVYILHATSDEMLKSLKSKVRLGLKDMKYSEMVQKVYEDYAKVTKPIEVEETQHIYDFCISNMNPFKFISHVSSRSLSPNFGGCLFFFFEDRDKFNYKSLGALFNETPIETKNGPLTFNFAANNMLKTGSASEPKERNYARDMYTVESFEHKGSFDLIKTIMSGSYSQKAIFFDPVRQLINTKEFKIDDEWDTMPHTDDVKPFTDKNLAKNSPDSRLSVHWTNAEHDTVEHIASKEPGINPFRSEEFVSRVNSQLDTMTRNAIDVTLAGTPLLIAGKPIIFILPEHLGKVSKQNPEEQDAYLQGKYLVISVMHKITKAEYTCSATLIKDSFFSTIKHRNPEEVYPIDLIY